MQLHAEDVEVQHRRLRQLVNELASSLTSEPRRFSGVRRALASLINFSEIHFSDQEEFMKLYGYPRELLEVHTCVHEAFLEKLRAVQENTDADLVTLAPVLIGWIRDWIEVHVLTEDHAYLEHFRRRLRT